MSNPEANEMDDNFSLSDPEATETDDDSENHLLAYPMNGKLAEISEAPENSEAKAILAAHQISDLWLPLSRPVLRRFFPDTSVQRLFLQLQQDLIDQSLANCALPSTGKAVFEFFPFHAAFDDGDDIISATRVLGKGGVGIVEEVMLPTPTSHLVCVWKKIGRPKQLKAQQQVMSAFACEIGVMRKVDHHHCVRFLGSYTDEDSVNILSAPVADMDLATFLDGPLGEDQKRILFRGMNCVCQAM